MNIHKLTNLVVIDKACYIPLLINVETATLDKANTKIPANTITPFGAPFTLCIMSGSGIRKV